MMIRTCAALWAVLALSCLDARAISTPAETLKRAEAGRKVEPEWVPTVGNKGVEVLRSRLRVADIPRALKKLRRLEQLNSRIQDKTEFGGEMDMSILGPYDPLKAWVFHLPYIPIPAEGFSEYLVAENLPPELKRVLFFRHQGVEYARFFIHPSKTSAYEDLIEKYGIVRDEFAAFPGASPRSLYVWDPSDPDVVPFVAKVSLHYVIEDSLRINPPQKAARAFFVNDLFSRIPQEVRDQYSFDFMAEPVELLPKGKATATIYRALPPAFLDTSRNLIFGFNLSSKFPKGSTPPILTGLLEGERDQPAAAAELLRPFLRALAYLQLIQRMEGEPHEQNVIFEMKRGKIAYIWFKDLDSFRVDVEARIRQGLPVDALSRIFKPFVHAKFSKASGWGAAEGVTWDQVAYNTYVKRTFGHSFCQVLGCDQGEAARMERVFDRIMAEEASRITGLPVNPRTLGATSEEFPSGLNLVANLFRKILNESVHYDQLSEFWKTPSAQRALREQFLALRNDRSRRASALLAAADSENVYYRLHGASIIEARWIDPDTLAEEAVGFASLHPAEHPRTQAFHERIRRLAANTGYRARDARPSDSFEPHRPMCQVAVRPKSR
jgi:hypothetical protein